MNYLENNSYSQIHPHLYPLPLGRGGEKEVHFHCSWVAQRAMKNYPENNASLPINDNIGADPRVSPYVVVFIVHGRHDAIGG
jgi:hypothetical protein